MKFDTGFYYHGEIVEEDVSPPLVSEDLDAKKLNKKNPLPPKKQTNKKKTLKCIIDFIALL